MNGEDQFRPALTNRECEVLELVASGYSAKEAAGELEIAPRTVERHIENLRLKMCARNRAHLVARALAEGELSLDSEPGPLSSDRADALGPAPSLVDTRAI